MKPIVLAAVLLALWVSPAAAQTTDTTPLVSADGIGVATLTPDIADFSVTVSRLASTSARARTATNRRIASVLRVARARGVADPDIATRGLSVSRERVTRRGRLIRVRYRAEQTLVIRARNVAGLAALLDAVAEAGADRLGDPDFGFADPSAGRLLATRAALADARKRADDAAATQGLRITGVRSVTLAPQTLADFGDEDSGSGASGGLERAASAPTQISPGLQQFTERVRVVYTAAPL
jgi:uncharacterized protein YggE